MITKAAVLVCETESGEMLSFAGNKLDPIIELARTIRDSGKSGKEKIVGGVVLCSWRAMPQMKFNVSRHAAISKALKVEANKPKGKKAESDKAEKQN